MRSNDVLNNNQQKKQTAPDNRGPFKTNYNINTTESKVNNLVSLFSPPITNTKPNASITLSDVHTLITSPQVKTQTDQLRAITDKKERSQYKQNQLMFITPSGEFTSRTNIGLVKHSGYLSIDIDDKDDNNQTQIHDLSQLGEIRENLINDSNLNIILSFISPSGLGLKAIIAIEPDRHYESFKAVKSYVRSHYGLDIDKGCHDVARACFLCYDEDAYYNADNENIELSQSFIDEWSQTDSVHHNTPKTITTDTNLLKKVESCVTQIEAKKLDITPTEPDWTQVGWSLANLGEDGRDFFIRVSKYHPDYNELECNNKYDSILDRYDESRMTIGTFLKMCKDNGITPNVEASTSDNDSGLIIKTASQWINYARTLPPKKQLFGSLWHQGELAICFASTNVGKSILAVQLSDAIARGKKTLGLCNDEDASPVLYIDCEMTPRQFRNRALTDNDMEYDFHHNFYRAEINHESKKPKQKFEDWFISQVTPIIKNLSIKVLVVDNITFLQSDVEKAPNIIPLMNKLKMLRDGHDLSILVLAHTPKRDKTKPLTVNDLSGSATLGNAADAIFAIGESQQDKNLRYIKHIKTRESEKVYDYDNVITCELVKSELLKFQLQDFCFESEHLYNDKQMFKENRNQEIIDYHKQGLAIRKIAEITKIPKSTVANIIKNLSDDNSEEVII